MATWDSVVTYMRSNYRIQEEIRDRAGVLTGLRLTFGLDDLRSQVVFLFHNQLRGGEESWVNISSPFGMAAGLDLTAVLDEVGNYVCGGLGKVGDLIVLQHAAPLLNLDINELERPMSLIVNSADDLERRFGSAGDNF
ncbi:MAG: hypothetical protein KBB39_00350 [Phycicoccus sp.]|nr:hypothetical protein [Phycicoccus sp.]